MWKRWPDPVSHAASDCMSLLDLSFRMLSQASGLHGIMASIDGVLYNSKVEHIGGTECRMLFSSLRLLCLVLHGADLKYALMVLFVFQWRSCVQPPSTQRARRSAKLTLCAYTLDKPFMSRWPGYCKWTTMDAYKHDRYERRRSRFDRLRSERSPHLTYMAVGEAIGCSMARVWRASMGEGERRLWIKCLKICVDKTQIFVIGR